MAGPTVHTPFGEIPRNTAIMVGGGILLVGGVIWYRGRKAATDAASATSGDIDPATGFAFGSAEDIAALGQQGYANPSAGTGGPASPTYPYNPVPAGPGVFTNNAEWAQAAIEYLTGNGDVSDAGKLSAALGKYLAGGPVPDTGDQSLIEQAIAVEGKPPVAGPNGYPPAINTSHPIPNPTPTPTPIPKPNPTLKPGVGWYQVKRGDSIRSICVKNAITEAKLRQLNSANALNRLTVGEWVRVRGRAGPRP